MKSVGIRGRNYQVIISGKGVPCLTIGNGLLVQRTISSKFQESFKVYASDLYWGYNQRFENSTSLTFEQILQDVIELNDKLGLEKPIIFGFSAFGIVALELVKRYPDLARAVIMVGTPLNSNQNIAKKNQKIFEESASEYRRKLYLYRKNIISQKKLSNFSFQERFKHEYIFRDAPKYWHNPEYDCSKLWEGIELDQVIEHFFANIIPFIDVTDGIEKINIPVYLAAGLSDFDCCPAQAWGAAKKLPPNFVLETYANSGHYPQLEEYELFDRRIIEWLERNKLMS